MRGPRKSTSLHGVLTLDFDPTKFQLDKRKEMKAKDSFSENFSVLKRLCRYIYNFVMYMLCCACPLLNGSLVERDNCCCWEGAWKVRKFIAEKWGAAWRGEAAIFRWLDGLM